MNLFLKSSALATLFTLALVTNAKAVEPIESNELKTRQVQSQPLLIAEDTGEIDARQFEELRSLNRMVIQQMEMMDAALPLLQSDNPEIRRMAMEMLRNTNAMTERMMSMRNEMFSLRIRDGRN
ncbi:hypothetical protein H6F98_03305 [Microcoleus sp. FACHB-SPT15]|uniref:hypothetical protein n=1 Tax=Microcoleus sp. FACHB-SPT15 TaxID=2692830 RepID=UPI0017839261|nr:hypothetical protein [Microcoleus sp. FACHB-SPT15]MBD1804501.1 hypothetical protein [Microcoleus sp. FACHB-SPT15]